ncbi:hypothetical protein CGZ93_04270 [Enemella dayhoffiae]|uniref:Phospholipid/glycerol acyltransferase domain-containing protein n=1 Tax=Enemella dayhoffiae TaxID=2016507 RepID=A0A255HA33_9ACTN|nr:1-acyl-sn-glycerol-3-phosphate acyltransferase [Enemella dayhoffiae]OYO24322.1 hypothetical protein CGZ93_04270 [Enemella dayhoffiae]
MSEQQRELARWARGGRRRPRLAPRLLADLRKVGRARGWSGPDATLSERGASPHALSERARNERVEGSGSAASPASVLRAVTTLGTPRGLSVDGGDPARLPAGGVVLVANHPTAAAVRLVLGRLPWSRRLNTTVLIGDRSQDRLVERLRRGGTVLAFPEGRPNGDGSLREFGDAAARLAARAGVPVVPVGVRGALSVPDRGRSRARVAVRFGNPLGADAGAPEQRAAVAALLEEDAGTWWQVQRRSPASEQPATHGWRLTWAETAPARRGGSRATTRIWR